MRRFARIRSTLRCAIAALLCACSGVDAPAQVVNPVPQVPGSPQSIDKVRENFPFRLGPIYTQPRILIKEFGVDTNVFNQYGDGQSDFTFTLSPQANNVLPFGRRGLLKMNLAADLVYFAHYTSERSVDPAALLRGELYARHLTLFVEESYLNTRERPNQEIDVRARHVENDLSAGGAYQFTQTFSLEAAVRDSRLRFEGDEALFGQSLAETLDRDTNAYRVVARHEHSALTTFGLLYENQIDRFPQSPERDTDSFRVMPGVEFQPRALINGNAWAGYRSFTPKYPILKAQSGLVAQLALSYTLLGATAFAITYNRDYQFSYEALTPYFVDNNIGISVRRAIGGSYDVIAHVTHYRYDYEPLALEIPEFIPSDRVDTINNYGINVGYRMKRQARVGVGVSRWTRTTTASTVLRDYDDIRVALTMTYEL